MSLAPPSVAPPTRPLRVAYLLSCAPFAEQEQFVLEEAAELLDQGVELLVCPLRPGSAPLPGCSPELLARAIPDRAWSGRTLAAAARQAVRAPGSLATVARVLASAAGDEPRLEPLARNAFSVPKTLALAAALRRWRPDHIHAHFGASTATAAWILGDVLGVPWSFTAHSPTDISKRNLLSGKVRSARLVRTISEDGARRVRAGLPQELWDRIVMLPMGVRARGAHGAPASAAFAPTAGATSVICVGRLIEAKGHRHLLEAVALLRDRGHAVVCHLCGDGDQRTPLTELAERLGVADRVVLHGYVPNPEILAVLDAGLVDLAVLPSFSEGVPITLMEAMARDIPVVASDVGGVSEIVSETTGRLVPPRDSGAVAAAMLELSEGAGRSGVTGGRRLIADRYCLSRNSARLRELYAPDRVSAPR